MATKYLRLHEGMMLDHQTTQKQQIIVASTRNLTSAMEQTTSLFENDKDLIHHSEGYTTVYHGIMVQKVTSYDI